MSGWETRIATGNPQMDQMTVEQHRQAALAQGLSFDVQPLPGGGFQVRAYAGPPAGPAAGPPMGGYGQQPPQAWGQPGQGGYGQQPPMGGYGQAPQGGYGAPAPQAHGYAPAAAAAVAGGGMVFNSSNQSAGGVVVGGAAQAPALTQERVKYLRKVYGLLLASVVIAFVTGLLAVTVGPDTYLVGARGSRVAVPMIVAMLLSSRAALYGAFALLFVATLIASAVSKVRVLNVIALFGVAALMGIELAPMVFVAQYMAGLGKTMSAAPVLGAGIVTAGVFAGATGYVFVTRKDFSYLSATVSMGLMVVFFGAIVAIFVDSEPFTLAICSVGGIVASLMILLQTSRIFRNSQMDDAVGDCLVLLVQLRNLFMFILRILMSSRR